MAQIAGVQIAGDAVAGPGGFTTPPQPPSNEQGMPWPPKGPVTITELLPFLGSYLYVQYRDDEDLQAFVDAYNIYSQAYLDYANGLNLPVYINGNISGPLLDWVAAGLYGLLRPGLPTRGTPDRGPFNSWTYNSIPFNGFVAGKPSGYILTSDDTFKRVLTWFFYKGDGKVFTMWWLKRRIQRFLTGFNGTDVLNDNTYAISVYPTGFKAYNIDLATTPQSEIFAAAVEAGVLELPVQVSWTVNLL
jgi:hypothetical protein